MNIALAAVALAVGAGAIAAVSIRELRAALIGLAAVLVGGSLLSDPLPAPATLGVRIVGGLLVVAILQATLPEGEEAGSAIGWPAETLIAIAAALAGLGIALTLLSPVASGVDVGQTGGLARVSPAVLETMIAAVLLGLGAAPAALGRSGARRAIGVVLVAEATVVVRTGLAGPPGDFEQLAIVGLLIACAAVFAVLARAADLPSQPLDETS